MTGREDLQQEMMQLEALLIARAGVYEMLHMALGGQPDKELIECLAAPELSDCLDEFAGESETLAKLREFLTGLQAKVSDPVFLEMAHTEYNRFFQGPAALPAYPWESANLGKERVVFQPSTLEVRAAYHALGLKVMYEKHLPDDHISIMCAFLAEGGRRILKAWRAGELAECSHLLNLLQGFLAKHVNNWLPTYADDCLHTSKAILYPQLVHGARDFAKLDEVLLANTDRWLKENTRKPDGEKAAVMTEGEEASITTDDAETSAVPGEEEAALEPQDFVNPSYDRQALFAAVDRFAEKAKALKPKNIEDNTLIER